MLCCRGDQFSYMIHGEDTPDPGPDLPTRYQPGQPGQLGDSQHVTIMLQCYTIYVMCKSYHVVRRGLDRC